MEAKDYLFGLNSFLTADENNHKRLSIGFEVSDENFNFNTNRYMGLDDRQTEGIFKTKTTDGLALRGTDDYEVSNKITVKFDPIIYP